MAKSKSEAQFQAEMDAHTLAEAEVIKVTPARMRRARGEARKQAVEQEKKARGLRRVAGVKPAKKTAPKRSRKR